MSKLPFGIHPGRILQEEFLAPYRLSVEDFAEALKLQATKMRVVISGAAPVTGELAILLGTAFGTSPEFWMNLQKHHDLELGNRQVKDAQLAAAQALHERLLAQGAALESRPLTRS